MLECRAHCAGKETFLGRRALGCWVEVLKRVRRVPVERRAYAGQSECHSRSAMKGGVVIDQVACGVVEGLEVSSLRNIARKLSARNTSCRRQASISIDRYVPICSLTCGIISRLGNLVSKGQRCCDNARIMVLQNFVTTLTALGYERRNVYDFPSMLSSSMLAKSKAVNMILRMCASATSLS